MTMDIFAKKDFIVKLPKKRTKPENIAQQNQKGAQRTKTSEPPPWNGLYFKIWETERILILLATFLS